MSDAPDALSDDLTARFVPGAALGSGGFGAVLRATERATGREVALKLLRAEDELSALERFRREAAVTAALDHPGIVKVHAIGLHTGRPAIVYELIEGQTFDAAIRTLDLRRRTELVRDAARAVGHAHAHGVVHRDLKPGNILVDREGRARVADFGLALVEGADRLTRTGGLVGTPAYMAPECFESAPASRGPSVDVWALGVVLYEALTGRLPFASVTLPELLAMLAHATPIPPRKIDPTIERAIEAVCLRALRRDPNQRPRDGEALARELDDALAGRGAAPSRRFVGPLLACGLALLAFLAVGRKGTGDPGPVVAPEPPAGAASVPSSPPTSEPALIERRLGDRGDETWAAWLDERRLLCGDSASLTLWDVLTGRTLRTWSLEAGAGASKPGLVLIGTEAGELLRLDPVTLEPLRVARFDGPVSDIALAAEAPRVALRIKRPRGRELLILDTERWSRVGEVPETMLGGLRSIGIALSPRGEYLAIGSEDPGDRPLKSGTDGPLFLVLVERPELALRLPTPGRSTALAFSRDGSRLYAGTTTSQLFAIDPVSGQVLHDLVAGEGGMLRQAHTRASVRGLALTRDGRRMFSVGDLGSHCDLRVWDLQQSALAAPPRSDLRGAPRSLVFSPDESILAIGTEGGGVHVLPPPR